MNDENRDTTDTSGHYQLIALMALSLTSQPAKIVMKKATEVLVDIVTTTTAVEMEAEIEAEIIHIGDLIILQQVLAVMARTVLMMILDVCQNQNRARCTRSIKQYPHDVYDAKYLFLCLGE